MSGRLQYWTSREVDANKNVIFLYARMVNLFEESAPKGTRSALRLNLTNAEKLLD
jgi:hypothetical protein